MTQKLFGTDGIRGYVGKAPFDHETITTLGHAIARWAVAKYGNQPTIIFGQDTRSSGDWISATLAASLLRYPITMIHAGVLPTPALCRILQQSPTIDCALMISASHNPANDNGIKIIDRLTGKLSANDESYISELMTPSHNLTYTDFGSCSSAPETSTDYIESITPLFKENFLSGLAIGIDCANGASYQIAPAVFKKFGADVISLNNMPTGMNINDHCGSQYPQQLQKAVISNNLAAGFAFDGDGDRVIAVDGEGNVKNGDDILALLTQHPLYANQETIVGTVMSNVGLEIFLRNQHKKLVRTAVGDKYIAHYLHTHNLLLGGEQSGHIIMNDYLPTGDGIITALRVLEVVLATNNRMLSTFSHFPQLILNIPVTTKRDLQTPEIADIIRDHENDLDNGRLIVRYSGTENLLRIMVEDRTLDNAQYVSERLGNALKKYL